MPEPKGGPKFSVLTTKHPQKIHAWGCISHDGVGEIYTFRQNLDANLYKSILKKTLFPSAEKLFRTSPKSNWYLLQDRDPKHRSKIVSEWLERKNVNVLWNPPQSPDLNPIENVWKLLKDKVSEKQPKNIKRLEQAIHQCWGELDPVKIRNCVNSMPKRLQAVLDVEGEQTKY
jgi:transposase